MRRRSFSLLAIYLTPLFCIGCWSGGSKEVVVYSALDSEFAEPVLQSYEKEHGLTVATKFDVEANKTVGLVETLIAERARPRCDVFWNNEILHTLRLEKLGLLAAYSSPAGETFPAEFRSPTGTWYGFAARARVLLVNTERVAAKDRPGSILDLTNEKWRGQCGLAKPLFGTTATHAACLFAAWGPDKAEDVFRKVKANDAKVYAGNKQVARAVSGGEIMFGLTDTDDALEEVEAGRPVKIIYPDQADGEIGTLFIPNTVSILKDCPHPAEARQLVEYLLSPGVEERLSAGPSAQIPLNPQAKVSSRVETPATVRAMPIDFSAAADQWETAARFLGGEFAEGK